MKFKKVLTALVASAVLVTPLTAFSNSSTAETEGRIRFIADPEGGGIYDIHHPDNSEDTSTDAPLWIRPLPPISGGNSPETGNAMQPGGPGGAGTAGPLRINFAPSFYFGTQLISDVNQEYYAYFLRAGESQRLLEAGEPGYVAGVETWVAHRTPTVTGNRVEENIPHFIQVTDARGTMGGWTLTVANTPFSAGRSADFAHSNFDNLFPGGRHVLAGTTLTFANVVYNTYANNSASNVAVHSANIQLDGSGAQRTVMSAAVGSGAGIHQAVWGTQVDANNNNTNGSIALAIPGVSEQLGGIDYTTTLTWLLTDAPGNH